MRPADHHTVEGSATGDNSTTPSAASDSHRLPPITVTIRNVANTARRCNSPSCSAGSHHCKGANLVANPDSRNAPGIKCP